MDTLENILEWSDNRRLSFLFKELDNLKHTPEKLSLLSELSWNEFFLVYIEELLDAIDFCNVAKVDNSVWVKALNDCLDLHCLFYISIDELIFSHYSKIPGKYFTKLEISFQLKRYQITSLKERLYDKILPSLEKPDRIWRGHLRFSKFVKVYKLQALSEESLGLLESLLWTIN